MLVQELPSGLVAIVRIAALTLSSGALFWRWILFEPGWPDPSCLPGSRRSLPVIQAGSPERKREGQLCGMAALRLSLQESWCRHIGVGVGIEPFAILGGGALFLPCLPCNQYLPFHYLDRVMVCSIPVLL